MTDLEALEALRPLPPEELHRQWLLSRNRADLPSDWRSHSLGRWHLAAHPDARLSTLRAVDGSALGWIIEPMLQLTPCGGTMAGEELSLDVPPRASAKAIERALYGRDEMGRTSGDGIEGAWVAIVLGGSDAEPLERVYLGAVHSVVFSPDHQVVATTHNLVPDLPRDVGLSQAFDPLANNNYFTFGLTPFVGLHRLLPNHYLDLATFRPVRHWPRGEAEPLQAGEDGAAAIVHHSRRILEVLATEYPAFRIFLSAGHDSRAVLALTRPLVAAGVVDVRLSTSVGPDLGSRVDAKAARRLAQITGLPHEVSARERHRASDPDTVMRAFARIGESKSGPILSAPELLRAPSPQTGYTLAGMAGETGRAYFWRRGLPQSGVDAEFLARRTDSPLVAPVLSAAEAWLQGLPAGLGPEDTLDLAYVEQRLGCWESTSRYLFPGRPRVTSPMAAAYNLQTMLRLPRDYRAAGRVQRDMVEYGWPELLQVPFNTPTGGLRLEAKARRVGAGLRRRLTPERQGPRRH